MSVFYPFMSIFFCILQPDILKRLCHMNLLMDPFLCEAFNFGCGLDAVLTSRGGDLILICCSCYTYLSLLQPVTRQWKEKQQTIELASLSLCSCLLSANPFHCSTTNWLLVVLLSLPAWALLVITRGWYQVKFKYLHFLHLKNTLWGILKEKFVQSLFGHTSILGHRVYFFIIFLFPYFSFNYYRPALTIWPPEDLPSFMTRPSFAALLLKGFYCQMHTKKKNRVQTFVYSKPVLFIIKTVIHIMYSSISSCTHSIFVSLDRT